MRRWARRSLLILFLILAAGAAGVAWRLWRALPQTGGAVRVAGLHGQVEVIRDDEGVPHIRAASEADALFGLGYVHAQDRLWQMEFQRRLAAGRLSEILGPEAVETDRLMRTIGFARAARESLGSLDAGTRALLDSYIAGINAFLQGHRGTKLPVEFALLRYEPAPFHAEDSIAWQKIMGWSMSTNYREELLRLRLRAKLGAGGAEQLLPASASGDPLVIPDFVPPPAAVPAHGTEVIRTSLPPGASVRTTLTGPSRRTFPLEPVVGGSNAWVVSGTRTVTGKPLLANDPHLGAQAPGVWYVAHVTGGALDAIGATLPGAPAVVIGHNGRIAWGVTNMMADVQDLFAEQINERDETLVDGRWEPMRVRHETIAVKGSPPVTLRIRFTRHGPLISDLIDERTPLALRWTGHDPADRTARAFLRINRARTWDEFTAAFEDYHVPVLNFVYADAEGNIGYIGPGALPLRAGDGRHPMDGTTRANDWRGYVPAPELPRAFNPRRGYVASSNNKVLPDSYPHVLSTDWEVPYRASRIAEVLERKPRATTEDMQRLQTDQHSLQPARLLPLLLRADARSPDARAALDLLERWNGSIAGDSAAAAIFKAYYARAAWRLFADELGAILWEDYRGFTSAVAKAFDAVAHDPRSRWCDDETTPGAESCEATLGDALELALEDLRAVQGTGDSTRWRWDRQNVVWFPHLPLHSSWLLRPFFSRQVRRGGDAFTVNPSMPVHDRMLVASYRQILDLSDVDRSVFILPLGQSGQPFSRRYANLVKDWNEGRYRPLRFTRAAVDAGTRARLVLEPGL